MTLVFLDTETTGLDPFVHDVWEVAWATDDSPIRSEVVVHSLKTADPKALETNGYWERFPDGARSARGPVIDLELRNLLNGRTIVGANPAFDTAFLFHRWRVQPWNYRLIDISSMAVQAFGLRDDDKSWGLFDVRQLLLENFDNLLDIPEPDHTAAGDVATLRACYNALTVIRETPRKWVTGMLDPASQGTSPACTCPITDPVERSTAYTVARLDHEPHAVGCPRRGWKRVV